MQRGASPLNGEVGGGDAQSIGDVDLRITDQKLNQFTISRSLFHSLSMLKSKYFDHYFFSIMLNIYIPGRKPSCF